MVYIQRQILRTVDGGKLSATAEACVNIYLKKNTIAAPIVLFSYIYFQKGEKAKMKKRVFASLMASLLVVCMLGTSVFASTTGEVVFSDSFEIEPIDDFYVSMPEIRAYGECLLGEGYHFDDNNYSDNGVVELWSDTQSYGDLTRDDNYTKLPGASRCVILSKGSGGHGIHINFAADKIAAGGVYEVEAYIKGTAAGIPVSIKPCFRNGMETSYADNGQAIVKTTTSTDWERIVSRFSFDAALTATGTVAFDLNIAWPNETDRIYLDDLKFRKVENAVQSTINGQTGMPTYPISALAGKTNAQVVMDVKNETGAPKDLTLITAYYNEDGSLNTVLNVYKTSVPTSVAIQHIESNEFAVPAGVTAGEIKTFAWNDAKQLFPYTEKVDSEYATYHQKAVGDQAETQSFWSKPLPSTKTWVKRDNIAYGSANLYAAHTESVESGVARTGARALYIPTIASAANESIVGTTFPIKPGRKYEVKFYVAQASTYMDSLKMGVTGATPANVLKGDYVYAPAGTWNTSLKFHNGNEVLSGNNLAQAPGQANGSMLQAYSAEAADPFWKEVTFTFETPAAGALLFDGTNAPVVEGHEGILWDFTGYNYGLIFAASADFYSATSSMDAGGAWIDDITVTDIGPAGE